MIFIYVNTMVFSVRITKNNHAFFKRNFKGKERFVSKWTWYNEFKVRTLILCILKCHAWLIWLESLQTPRLEDKDRRDFVHVKGVRHKRSSWSSVRNEPGQGRIDCKWEFWSLVASHGHLVLSGWPQCWLLL